MFSTKNFTVGTALFTMSATMFVALFLWMFLCINRVIGATDKHAMKNECTYNNLNSGTYRCILPDDGRHSLLTV